MTLIHKDYHIPMIRAHSKTETRREWKSNYAGPVVGSVHMAVSAGMLPEGTSPVHASHDDCDCYVQVMGKYPQPLGGMTDENARNEGDYESVDEFQDGYERVYGDGAWDPEKVVTVVEYEYVGREIPSISERVGGCPNCGFSREAEARSDEIEALFLGELSQNDLVCEYHRTEFNQHVRETAREAGTGSHE